jgi:DNA-binding protein YbaB
MTCKNEVRKVFIDDSLMQDNELLEDLILVALKDTQAKIEATTSQKMSGLVPPGMNLPF